MTEAKEDPLEHRVLALTPTARDAAASKEILEANGMPVQVCTGLDQICREARLGAGALLITEEALRSAAGRSIRQVLDDQPPWSDLPLIVLTPSGHENPHATRAFDAFPNVTLVKCPVELSLFVSTVQAALRDRRRQYAVRSHLIALSRSEERYRTLFGSMDQGFCVLQVIRDDAGKAADWRFLEVNPAFETQTGLKDAAGKRMRTIIPDHDEFWFETYGRVAETGEPLRFQYTGESMDGQSFDLYAFPIGEPAEQKVAVLFNNITHRLRNQAEREQLVDQLTEADRRKDEFLAMLAHELRNPLGAISSGVELVQRVQKPEVLAELRGMIQHQVGHLTHLIDDLLDVSRITQGKVELRKRTLELTAITRKAAEIARPQIDEKRHELIVATPGEPVMFVADPTRVEQMLSNLLTNAAKYSEPGREIRLTAEAEGEEVTFRVRDQGYGITPEMLPRIFGLFTQIDATIDRSRGGLGIGLTLVKNLAELHGGNVSASSDGKDEGAEFTLRLPIGRPEPTTTGAITPPAPMPARQPPGRCRILIIDDNRDTARMTSRLLGHQGYHMMMAHDGHEGVEAAKAFTPDVILLDIGLPGLSGYEVAEAIRGHQCCRKSILVAVSGYGEPAARERSKQAGIDHHLTKPLDFDHLDAILATLAAREPEEV